MALPTSYNRSLDTLATVASDDVSANLIQLFSDGDTQFLDSLSRAGRIMQVRDTEERVEHFMHQSGGGTRVGHNMDNFGAGATLTTATKEILAQLRFSKAVWTQNVPYVPTIPEGDQQNYMKALFEGNGIETADILESRFLLGNDTFDGANPEANACFAGDTDYDSTDYHGMSLLGLLTSGTEKSGVSGSIDKSDETFAGLSVDDAAKWAPGVGSGTANGSALIAELDSFARDLDYGGRERPTHIWTGDSVYEQIIELLRDDAALPTPLAANMGAGYQRSVPLGDIAVHRHRKLDTKDVRWDFSAGATAEYPIVFMNYNSLRFDVVMQGLFTGGAAQDIPSMGFIKTYPGSWPVATSTNWFKRLEMKSGWSLEHGRRSFGQFEGITL